MRLVVFSFLVGVAAVRSHLETSTCGKTKQCIFVPQGCETENNCRQIFSYAGSSDGWTDMELYSTLDSPNNNYISVGFSKDDLMGDDAVTHCAFTAEGKPEAHLTFNFGKSNAPSNEEHDQMQEKSDLELVHAHKDEKSMYCQVRQKSGQGVNPYFPDLSKNHQIFLVRGKTRQPRALSIHSLDPNSPDFPFISDKQVAVGAPMNLKSDDSAATNADANDNMDKTTSTMLMNNATTTSSAPSEQSFLTRNMRVLLIKVHGILMIVAWFLFVALAILSARYLRNHFPSSTPMGLKWWFHLHRTFNVIALPLIIIATFLIFMVKGWSWTGPVASADSDYNTNPGAIHSLAGAIAVSAAILNPLMSLLRCAPDTGARPIFNWSHRIVGIVGLFAAGVAITIAASSFVNLWSDSNWGLAVVVFYIVIFFLIVVFLEILSYLKLKRSNGLSSSYELRHTNGHRFDDNGRVVTPTKVVRSKPIYGITFLYFLFALFAFCIVTALIILIVI